MKYTQITIEMSAEEMRESRSIGQNIMDLLFKATKPVATEPAPIEPEDEEEDEEDDEEDNDLLRAFRAYEN